MTDPRATVPSVRILVALDASPHGRAALDAAASLAADLRADLQALFVEDINLLRLAALPFTREVDQTLAAIRPLDTAAMEQALRAKAAEVRQAMAVKAGELRLQWSFQVVRGEFVRSSLAAATPTDLLILARESRIPKSAQSTTRTARLAEAAPILVAHDGSPGADRALRTATKMARRLRGRLVVLNMAETAEQRDSINRSLASWLGEQHLESSIENVPAGDVQALLQAARHCNGRVLVVNRDCHLLNETTIGSLVDELEHPVVLVG